MMNMLQVEIVDHCSVGSSYVLFAGSIFSATRSCDDE